MAENLTNNDTFDATIQMPVAGELGSAPGLRDAAIQRLTNRTYYNQQRHAETTRLAYVADGLVFSRKRGDVSAKVATVYGVEFSDDGLNMYVVGTGNGVHQYTLSTAWDVSTLTFSQSKTLTDYTGGPLYSVRFKPDGTEMYIAGDDTATTISQYTLGTAWDISTAPSTASYSYTISESITSVVGFALKSDGSKLYVLGSNLGMWQYSLGTDWRVSTASYDSVTIATSGGEGDIAFNDDGTTAVVVVNDDIEQWEFPTPWVLTGGYKTANSTIPLVGATTNDQSTTWGNSGGYFYTTDGSSGEVLQYYSSKIVVTG